MRSRLLMRVPRLFFMAAFLVGCGSDPATNRKNESRAGSRSGDATTVSLETYQWRNDPRCYVAVASVGSHPPPQALKWHNPRHFSGYLYQNFEGTDFVAAERRENSEGLGEG